MVKHNNSKSVCWTILWGWRLKGSKYILCELKLVAHFFTNYFSIKSKKYLILTSNNRNAVAGKIRFTDVEYQREKNKSKNPNSGYLEEFFSLISWGSTSGSISRRIFKTIVINSCVRQPLATRTVTRNFIKFYLTHFNQCFISNRSRSFDLQC